MVLRTHRKRLLAVHTLLLLPRHILSIMLLLLRYAYRVYATYGRSQVRAVTLDWGDESTWEEAAPPVDVILAADVVYQADETSPLLHAILSLLKPGGSFFHVAPVSERDGLEGFLARLCGTGGGADRDEGEGGAGAAAAAAAADAATTAAGGGSDGGGSGFELVSATEAPPEYTGNPLVSGSQDEYMVHFNELPSTTFRLHEFRKR